jgi:transcriptional regulator with PAS, ATPase and Fis domain
MLEDLHPTEKTSLAEGREHILVQKFRLQVLEGPDAGKICPSAGQRTVIGKDEGANLILTDQTVSRFHCEISIAQGRAIIRDLGSRNGTQVNGVDVTQASLKNGAILTLGSTQIRFDLGTDHAMVLVSESGRFGLLVGRSLAMRAIFALLERAAANDVTVLIEGETGTGKEVAAESVHAESARRDQPFVVVDCGAVAPDLLESELFGHERGAFTGAVAARTGAFEAANGGTIFLDEIGELGADLQPKLLRALERKEIKRVGSSKYFPVDVRVIAATNRNLRSEVNARRFRSDLFYRLAVLTVRLPPVRERLEDLPLLVEHLLRGISASEPEDVARLQTPEFLDHLARHPWPGNVRELRNYLERCLAVRERMPIVDESAGADMPIVNVRVPLKTARENWLRILEHKYLDELLRQQQNNVSAAARAAGLDRRYFYQLLWRYGLR